MAFCNCVEYGIRGYPLSTSMKFCCRRFSRPIPSPIASPATASEVNEGGSVSHMRNDLQTFPPSKNKTRFPTSTLSCLTHVSTFKQETAEDSIRSAWSTAQIQILTTGYHFAIYVAVDLLRRCATVSKLLDTCGRV